MKKILLKSCLLFLLSITCNVFSQWKYPNAENIKRDVIITYEVAYEKVLTEKQKKSPNYKKKIVVVFNKNKLIEKRFTNILNLEYFYIFDYNKEVSYNCRSYKNDKVAIKSKFRKGSTKVVLLDEPIENILGFPCQIYETTLKGEIKKIYTTKSFGLKYTKQFNTEGFLLKYSGISKYFGRYTVTAKNISYGKAPKSTYSIEGFTVRTKEEQKQYIAKREEKGNKYKELAKNKVGEKSPNFSFRTIDGRKIKSKDLLGKVVVLNFWFTTCPPCKKEIPDLNRLKKEFEGKDVEFLAIALDEEYKIASFLKKIPFTYEIVDSGSWLKSKFDVTAYPSNIIIDKKGVIQFYKVGYKSDIVKSMSYQINKYL
ncbi:MAG: TlpA disulfide reductase family protein [Polaribacter sp.]|uniref:TlpA family protein disulfide reductase n=1 Tax=Polaribacter sp. TaxID=1920175 RepID=UPI003263A9BA